MDEEVSGGGEFLLWPHPVPHQLLLPRCCMILHPGGSGTTACALLAGIPQVICPLHFDQFFWVSHSSVFPVDHNCVLKTKKTFQADLPSPVSQEPQGEKPAVEILFTEVGAMGNF